MTEAEETTPSKPPGAKSRLILIGLFVLLVSVGGAAVYHLISVQDDTREPVLLLANAEPYKVRPDDPGGIQFDNLNSPMMAILGGEETEDPETELLLPPEEEPELPPISVDIEQPQEQETAFVEAAASEDTQPVEDNQSTTETVAAQPVTETPEEETPQQETAVTETPQQETPEKTSPEADIEQTVTAETEPMDNQTSAPVARATPGAETDDASAAAVSEQSEASVASTPPAEEAETIESIDDAIAQVTKPAPKPLIKPVLPTGENAFLVQFAAFKSEKSARETAALLTTKHAARLEDMVLGYMRKGEYWRVVSAPLPRADASSMCRIFRSVGQDCIVKSLD